MCDISDQMKPPRRHAPVLSHCWTAIYAHTLKKTNTMQQNSSSDVISNSMFSENSNAFVEVSKCSKYPQNVEF